MVRSSTDAGSPYYGVFVTPGHGIAVQWRATQGAMSNQKVVPGAAPAYLRVGRATTTGANPQTFYSAYTSPDGTTWTAVPGSTVQLNLPGPLLAGFAITSHNQGTGSGVNLDSVAIDGTAPPPPGLCPNTWQCADIGGATPPGGQDVVGGTWNVEGGGGDIWDVADEFRFAWRPINADGEASAKITSQTPTNAWAKAGVMIRKDTSAGSPFYAILLSPANGIVVESRDTQGALAVQRAGIVGTEPVYLRVSRAGTTFTAETSPNGVNWTAVPNSAAVLPNLGGAAFSGLAVTSHDTGQLSTVVFSAVTPGTK